MFNKTHGQINCLKSLKSRKGKIVTSKKLYPINSDLAHILLTCEVTIQYWDNHVTKCNQST
jgi:hypothetical protein